MPRRRKLTKEEIDEQRKRIGEYVARAGRSYANRDSGADYGLGSAIRRAGEENRKRSEQAARESRRANREETKRAGDMGYQAGKEAADEAESRGYHEEAERRRHPPIPDPIVPPGSPPPRQSSVERGSNARILSGTIPANVRAQRARVLTGAIKAQGIQAQQSKLPTLSKTGGNSRLKTIQTIAKTAPNPQTGMQSWAPDPQLVLVLGLGLVGLSVLTQSGELTDIISRISLKPSEYKAHVQSIHTIGLSVPGGIFDAGTGLAWTLWGELAFVLVLYVIANVSDTLAKACVLFELAIYLLLLVFRGPQLITNIQSIGRNALLIKTPVSEPSKQPVTETKP